MTAPAARARPSRRPVWVLALAAVALLAGCSSDEEPAAAPATSAAPPPAATADAPAAATADAPADAPACPDGATLAAVSPDQAPGVRLTDPTCSGPWAVIGISGTVGPAVQVFRSTDGVWAPVDRAATCAAGELPADLEPAVCQAG